MNAPNTSLLPDAGELTTVLRAYQQLLVAEARAYLAPHYKPAASLAAADVLWLAFFHRALVEKAASGTPNDYLLLLPTGAALRKATELIGWAGVALIQANLGAQTTAPFRAGDKAYCPKREEIYTVLAVDADGEATEINDRSGGIRNPSAVIAMGLVRLRKDTKKTPQSAALVQNHLSEFVKWFKGDVPRAWRTRALALTTQTIGKKLDAPAAIWPIKGEKAGVTHTTPFRPLIEVTSSFERACAYVLPATMNDPTTANFQILLAIGGTTYNDPASNGLFQALLNGKEEEATTEGALYKQLVLVGDQLPAGRPSLHEWRWSAEELAVLEGGSVRYPVLLPTNQHPTTYKRTPSPRTEAALTALQVALDDIRRTDDVRLPTAVRLARPLLRTVLPPDTANSRTVLHEKRQWLLDEYLPLHPAFAHANRFGDEVTQLLAPINSALADLTNALLREAPKYATFLALRTTPGNTHLRIVLGRREAAATEDALRAVGDLWKKPLEQKRLLLIEPRHLRGQLADEETNRPDALWVLPSLWLGGKAADAAELFRDLLAVRARVVILTTPGYEEAAAQRVGQLHAHALYELLHHPGRSHFTQVVAPSLPATGGMLTSDGRLLGIDFAEWPTDDESHSEDERTRNLGPPWRIAYTDGPADERLPAHTTMLRFEGGAWRRCAARQLQPGNRVLRFETDRERVMALLRASLPEKFVQLDECQQLWLDTLRVLDQAYQHRARTPAHLYADLRLRGVSLSRLRSWLRGRNLPMFPRSTKNLDLLARKADELKLASPMTGRLPEVRAVRQWYNQLLASINQDAAPLLADAYLSGNYAPAEQILGTKLLTVLRDSLRERVVREARPEAA